jgi:hypothetical protein
MSASYYSSADDSFAALIATSLLGVCCIHSHSNDTFMLCARTHHTYLINHTYALNKSTAPRGPYSSGISFAGNTFTAVFVFQTVAVADEVLAGGGFQATAWLRENAAGDPIGLTISERDEASELCTLSLSILCYCCAHYHLVS